VGRDAVAVPTGVRRPGAGLAVETGAAALPRGARHRAAHAVEAGERVAVGAPPAALAGGARAALGALRASLALADAVGADQRAGALERARASLLTGVRRPAVVGRGGSVAGRERDADREELSSKRETDSSCHGAIPIPSASAPSSAPS